MLLLHERTRKSLCRGGFVLLCLIPTAVLLSWTTSRAGLSHRDDYQQELSTLLGLRATTASVDYPRPGVTRFHQVELFDPESRRLIAAADTVELRDFDDYRWIVATRPMIRLDQISLIWRALNEQLRRRSAGAALPIRFAAGELTLKSTAGEYVMADFQARVEGSDDVQGAALSFRPAGAQKSDQPVRMRMVRSRVENNLSNGFEIHTANATVPCGLFHHAELDLRGLGSQCAFAGSVWATEAADGWQGNLTGRVSGIDLRSAISERFAHRLNGPAQLDLQSAAFRRGRLEHAQGSLIAGPGFISESLLASAVQSLGLQRRIESNPQGDDLRYDMLALDFAIDESGLSLTGRCPSGQPGTVLAVQDRAMLVEPVGSSGPVVQLLRTLIPDSTVLVPATRETESLMKFLPIPPIVRN